MIQTTYHFSRIHHPLLFAHSLVVGLTPLIPIPFVDDWVKSSFQRRMINQITAAYGISLSNEETDALLQEDFWDSCVGGCVMAGFSLLRRVFRKILFFLEFRRGFNLFSQNYYTGFLLEAALMDGYNFSGPVDPANPDPRAGAAQRVEAARRLREAIRRTRYAANFKYVQRILRQTIRPQELLRAGWLLVRSSVTQLPGVLAALPRSYINNVRKTIRTVRGIPKQTGRAMADFYTRIQELFTGVLANRIIDQMSKALEAALLRLPPDHFDALRAQLAEELKVG